MKRSFEDHQKKIDLLYKQISEVMHLKAACSAIVGPSAGLAMNPNLNAEQFRDIWGKATIQREITEAKWDQLIDELFNEIRVELELSRKALQERI